ncbi:4-phosphoerythronate dehydrogenase [Bermanella sp. R86510]|uniref:4-phosphoerythronate dehydrogenase n=1 Tax=unclassified Bermanella TaxID=2627862 RepID=UPI0037CBEF77
MKIVADENIPLLEGFFAPLSQELVTLPGREMTAEHVADADIVLVRSVTQVNQALLENSRVRFVGTCTIGTDHIDTDYLDSQNIRWCNAPGCNAKAVVDYLLSCLLVLSEVKQIRLQDFSVGIVGVGNVGSLLLETLENIGVEVVAYDPFIEEFASDEQATAVWQQDVVSLHTPLTKAGDYPTQHLVDEKKLKQMQPNATLINACRGGVVDNIALLQHLQECNEFEVILDVYENEPSPSDELMNACLLATPHIAGYSLDGKYQGSAQVYEALCEFLALPKRTKLDQLIPEAMLRKVSFSSETEADYVLQKMIRCGYDVRDDHFRMRGLIGLSDKDKAKKFDQLRKDYPVRRDLNRIVASARNIRGNYMLEGLGIKIKS